MVNTWTVTTNHTQYNLCGEYIGFFLLKELKYFQYFTHNLTLHVHKNVYIFMLPCFTLYAGKWRTVSRPDWSQSFAFGVCSLLTLPIVLPSHCNCVNVCAWKREREGGEREGEREMMGPCEFVCAHLPVYVQHIHVC